jgi:hypothetical protein
MMPCERLTPERNSGLRSRLKRADHREIGKIVGTTEQVIKNHLRSTFDNLAVWSRLELAMYVAGKDWPAESEPAEIPSTHGF